MIYSSRMFPYIVMFFLITMCLSSGANGYFLGGTMSYTCLQNNNTGKMEVHIDMITGWSLDGGPCGARCSRTDVGTNTSLTRLLVEKQHHDPLYFGNWTIETRENGRIVVRNITNDINSHLNGEVMAVSEVGDWIQEQASIIYSLNSSLQDGKLDIAYEVFPMLTLPLQRSLRHTAESWHLQVKIDTRKRSDTGRPNSSPVALVKPVYRLHLDRVNQIKIPVVDPDGDIVKCFHAVFAEAGTLSRHPLPGISVEENCTITINTSSSLNYTDGLLGGVAIVARDYNKQEIKLGEDKVISMWALSGTEIQFLVHIVDNFSGPTFVQPSPPTNHRYDVYLGSTWEVTFYLVTQNTLIKEFAAFGRFGEKLNVSNPTPDKREQNKWHVTVSWRPERSDVGGHVFCVRAIDNMGNDAVDDRCYIVEVKLPYYTINSTIQSKDRPHFVDFPSRNETLKCDVDTTCIFPIFINSTNALMYVQAKGQLDTISTGPVYQTMHLGDVIYAVDLTMMNKTYGVGDICLTATDIRRVTSDRVCLPTEIIPLDPCLSSPCRNSATCSRKPSDPTDYQCKCLNEMDFGGKNCALKENKACDSNPCKHGTRCLPVRRSEFFCICRGSGFTGHTCEQAVGPQNTTPSQSSCRDDQDFPCHSNFNMCTDKAIADKYCRHTCGLCDGDVAFVG